MRRRDALRLIGAGAIAASAWPFAAEPRARTSGQGHPRFFLQIIPQGGMDAVYTTDPKKTAEVERGIDIPFGADQIVETRQARLGPGFKALARWMPKLAIVNAFRQNSANHLSGMANVLRCKSTSSTPATPGLLEILGSRRRHDEATAAIQIGSVMTSGFSPAYLGEPGVISFGSSPGVFDHLDKADPGDLRVAAAALRRDADSLRGKRATATEQTAADNLLAASELFTRVANLPKFAPIEWAHEKESWYRNGRDLQRVLWMFEHNLTRCATVCVGSQDFDTHLHNSDQGIMTDYLGSLLDHVFTELDKLKVDGVALAAQTIVIVGSEIGRFPRLNGARGKDHFPQAPFLLFGPGIATNRSYGATNRSMASVPVSLATGMPDSGGLLLRVDDIGTTLLALDGANPEVYGYTGEHLRFLVDG